MRLARIRQARFPFTAVAAPFLRALAAELGERAAFRTVDVADAEAMVALADATAARFGGIDGSAYFIGGFGFTAMVAEGITLVPIRTGLGWRLGVNLGYLKFTPQATWNPF